MTVKKWIREKEERKLSWLWRNRNIENEKKGFWTRRDRKWLDEEETERKDEKIRWPDEDQWENGLDDKEIKRLLDEEAKRKVMIKGEVDKKQLWIEPLDKPFNVVRQCLCSVF